MKSPIQIFCITILFGLLCLSSSCRTNDDFGPNTDSDAFDGPEDVVVSHPFLESLNKIRTEGCRCGSKSYPATHVLSWSTKLEASAKKHSEDMSDNDFFSHTGTGGSKFANRIKEQGYEYIAVGENIAIGYTNIATVMQAWFDSPDHCKNLMNSNFSEVGVASEGSYWTMDLGRPR